MKIVDTFKNIYVKFRDMFCFIVKQVGLSSYMPYEKNETNLIKTKKITSS